MDARGILSRFHGSWGNSRVFFLRLWIFNENLFSSWKGNLLERESYERLSRVNLSPLSGPSFFGGKQRNLHPLGGPGVGNKFGEGDSTESSMPVKKQILWYGLSPALGERPIPS